MRHLENNIAYMLSCATGTVSQSVVTSAPELPTSAMSTGVMESGMYPLCFKVVPLTTELHQR